MFLPNHLVVIASKQNSLSQRKRLKWEDLAGEKFLMRELGSGTHTAIHQHLDQQELSLGKTMTIESNEAIKYAVIENMGITILSAYALENLEEVELVQLPVKSFPIQSLWFVVHPSEKKLSLISQQFLDFVLDRSHELLPMQHIQQQIERALAKHKA